MFGPYLQNKNFPKYGIYAGTQQITNFYYTTNSVKINDQIFQKIQKSPVLGPFLAHFSNFEGKNYFLENTAVMHNFIWVSSPMPKFRKN